MEHKFGYTAGCAENDLLTVKGIIKVTIYKCKEVAETLQQAQLLALKISDDNPASHPDYICKPCKLAVNSVLKPI